MTSTSTHSPDIDGAEWNHTSPATADAATTLRRRVRRWAETMDLPDEVTHAIELAGYEALANVVEHAYQPAGRSRSTDGADNPDALTVGGRMTISARRTRTAITVTVTDTGVWHAPSPTPDRNHGLDLIEAISDRLDICGTDHGTQVTIVWTYPAPAAL